MRIEFHCPNGHADEDCPVIAMATEASEAAEGRDILSHIIRRKIDGTDTDIQKDIQRDISAREHRGPYLRDDVGRCANCGDTGWEQLTAEPYCEPCPECPMGAEVRAGR